MAYLLDGIIGLKAVYGFRQVFGGYSGACIQVTNGATTSDLTCGFSKATADALGTNLQIVKFYDLTGGGNHAVEVSGTKSVLNFDSYNRPYAATSSSQYQSASGFNLSAPKIFSVYQTTPSSYQYLWDFGGGLNFCETTNAGQMRYYNNGAAEANFGTYPTGVHQNTAYFQTGADRLFIDGIEKTNASGGTADTALSNGKLNLFSYAGGGTSLTGKFYEFILFDGAISSTNQQAIEQNQKSNLIDSPPPRITTVSPLPNAVAGVPYNLQLTVSGGTGSVVWSGEDDSYPNAGFALSSAGLITGTPAATDVGVHSLATRATDSLGASDLKTLTLTVVEAPAQASSRWTKMGIVPTRGLLAWHTLDNATDGTKAEDYSGNNRPLTLTTLAPVLQTIPQINNQKALYFAGSENPLKYVGSLTVKHYFVVAAFAENTFTQYRGLLGSIAQSSADLLIGNSSGDTFYNLVYPVTYKKNDLEFPQTAQKAPLGGAFAIIEGIIAGGGLVMDGLQLGQQLNLTDRKYKGWWAEHLIYGEVKNTGERRNIYRYLALKFHLWRQNADSLNIFPFAFDRSSVLEEDDLAEVSEAEGMRGQDKIVRYLDDQAICSYNLQFAHRQTIEFDATRSFCRQHRLHLPFLLEDCEKNDTREVTRVSKLSDTSSGMVSQDYGFNVRDY